MKYIPIGTTGIMASNIAMGCMRLKGKSAPEAEKIIRTYMEEGVNFFDHADIYGSEGRRGECESIFGEAMHLSDPSLRDKMIIQSKCGIVKEERGAYDFSKEHILEAVEGSLRRLKTDYLDFLLLHRPDSLMEPEEVAAAFGQLHTQGKVRYFGVSNHAPMQIELLQKYVPFKLHVNQLKLSILHSPMIDEGICANMTLPYSYDATGYVLEYSRIHEMTIQAWSPFQYGNDVSSSRAWPFLGDRENFAELNDYIDQLAEKYGVTNTAIACAWITRHPANMQVIVGSMDPKRIRDACMGSDIPLTRGEWYALYQAAGKKLP